MSEEKENRDYDHKPSVRGFTSEYNVSSEENPKPTSGQEPFPVWLMITCVLLMVIGGASIGSNSGGFNFSNSHQAGYSPSAPSGLTGKAPELSEFEKYVNGGEAVYKAVCNGCHQATGQGQGQIPPLVDSEWVTQGTERFAQIVLNGLSGPITVNGASYGAAVMPAQKGAINDKQVAQVMTYVRYKFGNISDTVVTKEMIEVARQKFGDKPNQYTVSELSGEDVMLEGEQPDWLSPESDETQADEAEENSAALPNETNQFNS
jgi:mono/diheme cytochrome c family protein|tara:strand:+ start:766 stop:1551 length:786 start_codon:yes stop_codon:yes gene_type:complete